MDNKVVPTQGALRTDGDLPGFATGYVKESLASTYRVVATNCQANEDPRQVREGSLVEVISEQNGAEAFERGSGRRIRGAQIIQNELSPRGGIISTRGRQLY